MEHMETNIFQEGPGPWPEISPIGPLGKNFGNVLGPVCSKPPQIMKPMEIKISKRGLDLGQNFPTKPLGKNSQHIQGPAWRKPPLIMKPVETRIFQKGLGHGQNFSQLAPLVKILGTFWDLPRQSHLR